MTELKSILVEEECFFYSSSFDIDDFIGDGVYWLQIYDEQKRMLYDKPFASSRGNIDTPRIIKTIKKELTFIKGII